MATVQEKDLIPVTILTGFLGAGKTTLLNRILTEQHGEKIAVIENEFGETGVDNDILVDDKEEQIIEMNNGCVCCTVRGDLVRILGDLGKKRKQGKLRFDRVIIETTGLANPGPVAQTFFMDEAIHDQYLLDAVVTVVDAKHAGKQLDEHDEARRQVGFADRILISKADLVEDANVDELMRRLRQMNPRAHQKKVHFGDRQCCGQLPPCLGAIDKPGGIVGPQSFGDKEQREALETGQFAGGGVCRKAGRCAICKERFQVSA